MTVNQAKKTLTFGEFIMAVYGACGRRQAGEIIWRAVNTHLVEFRGHDHFVILEPNPGKIFYSHE